MGHGQNMDQSRQTQRSKGGLGAGEHVLSATVAHCKADGSPLRSVETRRKRSSLEMGRAIGMGRHFGPISPVCCCLSTLPPVKIEVLASLRVAFPTKQVVVAPETKSKHATIGGGDMVEHQARYTVDGRIQKSHHLRNLGKHCFLGITRIIIPGPR